MSPSTVTETSLIDKGTKYIECNLTKPRKDNSRKIKHENKSSNLCYDKVLSTLNDPTYLKPVRDWEKRMGFVTPIRWINTIGISAFHIITVVWFIGALICGSIPKWQTILFGYFMGQVAGFGVTGGAHRYWCHRSYKAKWPLQIILLLCYSVAGQNNIYAWVRDHRVHHKFSETTADPHDANRGFFFSHVGWLMMKKHPDVLREGAKMDMTDIINDPLVQIHTKYFMLFKIALCFLVPSVIPIVGWNEEYHFAFLSQAFMRYMMSLNFTWSVNSFAHLWGNKPYDRYIMPVENWGVSIVAMGEGWHNYHHTFPWDYKAAELGMPLNITTSLINFFARIGWAYDMKEASSTLVETVARNKGERRKEQL